jgi:FkbM family methyltransferase
MGARSRGTPDPGVALSMKFRISYAQNREDFLIAAFFPDVAVGHYVDVGASDPSQYSVTKLFYDQGWSGINIEPIPQLADALRSERPRDVTVQVALGAEQRSLTFRQYAGTGLSTYNADIMAKHAAQETPESADFIEYPVDVVPLSTVLREHPIPHLHFLKIDVEGSEFDVLAGNDWSSFRPELLCIETDHVVRDWTPILADAGYSQVFHDGLNAYFLASEAQHRAEFFRYPQAVLSAPVIVTLDVGSQLDRANDLSEKVKTLTGQVDDVTRRNAQLSERVAELTDDLEQMANERQRMADERQRMAEKQRQVADDLEVRELALATEKALSAMYAAREAEVTARLNAVEAHFAEIIGSQSWRYTYPIRRLFEILRARAPRRLLAFAWRRVRPAIEAARTPTVDTGELSPDATAVAEHLKAITEAKGHP